MSQALASLTEEEEEEGKEEDPPRVWLALATAGPRG